MDISQKIEMFENRLIKNYKHKRKIADREQVSCWRLYENDIPEFPIYIEFYGEFVYVCEFVRHHKLTEEEYLTWKELTLQTTAKVLQVSPQNMVYRLRKRMDHKQEQYEKLDDSDKLFAVQEGGHQFLINLTNYLDTGLFLDHRITRKMVEKESLGKRVLNLFCYTGSFSVYAAKAGASLVTSVDMSNTYINWCKQNFELNQLTSSNYQFVRADAISFLQDLKPNSYDLIIIDPPTFSNSKKMKDFFDVQLHHAELINNALYCLSKQGIIYFSNNLSSFQLDTHLINSSNITDITAQTTPFDFKGKLKRPCFKIMKS